MSVEDLPTARCERALTLQNLLLAATEGIDKFDRGDDYRLLRREFMQDSETAQLLPQFVTTCLDIRQFWAFIKGAEARYQRRQQLVRDGFQPLLTKLQEEDGRRESYLLTEDGSRLLIENGEPIVLETGIPSVQRYKPKGIEDARPAGDSSFQWTSVHPPLDESVPVSAAGWTGRVNMKEHARTVVALAPIALEGIRALLSEHENRLHNQPPEVIDADELQALRDLHHALGQLIALAEKDGLLEEAIGRVAALRERVFKSAADTGHLMVLGIKPLLASAPAAWGTYALLGALCDPAAFVMLGPAAATVVTGGYFALETSRSKS